MEKKTYIIQITKEKLPEELWLEDNSLRQGTNCKIKSTKETTLSEKWEVVKSLVESVLPSGMAEYNKEFGFIQYNGGAEELAIACYDTLRKATSKFANFVGRSLYMGSSNTPVYCEGELDRIYNAIDNPLYTDYLFCTDEDGKDIVPRGSYALLELLLQLKKGDKLHIGCVMEAEL